MKSDVKKIHKNRGGTKRFAKSTISIVLSLLMVVSLFAALPLNVGAVEKENTTTVSETEQSAAEKQVNETTYIIVRFFEKNVLINQQVYVPYDIGNHCVDYCFSSAKALNITIKRKNVDSLLSCISNGFFSMYGSDYISVELAKQQLTMLLKNG